MNRPLRPSSSATGPPGWVGDLIAAVMIVLTNVGPLGLFQVDLTVPGVIAVVIPPLLMFVRRKFPWLVLALCLVCYLVVALTLVLTPFSALATGIAFYTISARTSRRTALITLGAVLAVIIPIVAVHEGSLLQPLTILEVVMIAFFGAAGDAVRSQRAYIAEITQRAVQAEQTREAEASRRVAEERLRIARDLHDTLAHQISVLSLNAGVASQTLDTDPETARTALAGIRAASRRMLGEIGTLLTTLRTPEDEQTRTQPTPGLDHLDTLVAEFEASGLHVTTRIDGPLDHLPAAVSINGYRIIQEALTNAHKHGAGARAHIWIQPHPGVLSLVVTNPAQAAAEPQGASSGHGLLGVRERVTALGGTLDAGHEGGTYRLEARLPMPESAVKEPS